MLRSIPLLVLALAAVFASGCYARVRTAGPPATVTYSNAAVATPTATVVYQAPPAPQVAVQAPPAPYGGAVWVEGHWQWNGATYVWVAGNYIQPRAGHVYVQPRWERRGNGYVYVTGNWRRGAPRGRVVVQQPARPRTTVRVQGPRPAATVRVQGNATSTRRRNTSNRGGGMATVRVRAPGVQVQGGGRATVRVR